MGFIYQVTNDINGKIYVGKTEDYPPEKRWRNHLREYDRPRCEKRPFYDAMNRYGPEHFHFELIEETDNVNEREMYWIDKLRTYVGFKDCKGYNATLGGDGGKILNLDEDEVVKYHQEQAKYIETRTAKHFGVDCKSIRSILIKHNIKWLTAQEAAVVRTLEQNGYIYQVNPQDKKIINKYETIKNIAELHKEFNKSSLKDAINGKARQDETKIHFYKGYYWYNDKTITNEVKEANNM